MRIILHLLIILGNIILFGCCSPLPFDLDFSETTDYRPGETTYTYHDKSEEIKQIKAAHKLANKQVNAMDEIVKDPTKAEHKQILDTYFGPDHDISVIQAHVDQLKTQSVKVAMITDHTLSNSQVANTYTLPGVPTSKIRFGPKYHESSRTYQDRAGILIHEATHALWGSGDCFVKDANGVQIVGKGTYSKFKSNPKPGRECFRGYIKDGGIPKLAVAKDKDSKPMGHMNADTWKAFGYHALRGKPLPEVSRAHTGTGTESNTIAGPSSGAPQSRASSKERKPSKSRAGSPEPHTSLHHIEGSDDIVSDPKPTKTSPGIPNVNRRRRPVKSVSPGPKSAEKSSKESLQHPHKSTNVHVPTRDSSPSPAKKTLIGSPNRRIQQPTQRLTEGTKAANKSPPLSVKRTQGPSHIRVPTKKSTSSPKIAKKPPVVGKSKPSKQPKKH